jgi:hypothetical protein
MLRHFLSLLELNLIVLFVIAGKLCMQLWIPIDFLEEKKV